MADTSIRSVFHAGEQAIQDRIGVTERLAPFAQRVIRNHIIDQHAAFYAQLPMLNIGAIDKDGRPWATASFGKPGFVKTPDEQTLLVQSDILLAETLGLQLTPANKIGILGLQPYTRRRNRLNGVITSKSPHKMEVSVDQSFGNCPQFIQKRQLSWHDQNNSTPSIVSHDGFDERLVSRLQSADTFFIASRAGTINADPRNGIDVSHRGGRPGFVKVEDGILSFPDFRGNNYFNTLGNIMTDNRVGLFFPDFETGEAIFLSGEAHVIWDTPRVINFAGAERIIDIKIKKSVHARNAIPLKGKYIEQWPLLEGTEIWTETQSSNSF